MSKRYTQDSFISALGEINPNIEALSLFTKVVDRIDVRCKKCGMSWSQIAGSLLRGQGCPICRRKRAAERNKRKVYCVETGGVFLFPSAIDAAKALGLKISFSIIQAIKKDGKSGGYHYYVKV